MKDKGRKAATKRTTNRCEGKVVARIRLTMRRERGSFDLRV